MSSLPSPARSEWARPGWALLGVVSVTYVGYAVVALGRGRSAGADFAWDVAAGIAGLVGMALSGVGLQWPRPSLARRRFPSRGWVATACRKLLEILVAACAVLLALPMVLIVFVLDAPTTIRFAYGCLAIFLFLIAWRLTSDSGP